MRGAGRAAAWGVGLALLAVAAVAVAAYTGLLVVPGSEQSPDAVVVILSAPDESGDEVARLAFEVTETSARALDTSAAVIVPGTSAVTPAQALTFGGGAAVAKALAPQTGGVELPWVVLPSDAWSDVVDAAGGLRVELPADVRSYSAGRLDLIPAGNVNLTGPQLLAVLAAADYFTAHDRDSALRQVESGLASDMPSVRSSLPELLAQGAASSSLNAAQLSAFAGAP